MITKVCEVCGNSFDVKPYRETKTRFCSKKCGGTWHCRERLNKTTKPWAAANLDGHRGNNTTSFKKGHKPWNRGVVGIHLSPRTEFKKGCESNRVVPIGTVTLRTCKRGVVRAFVKVSEPSGWAVRAVKVWEDKHGPVPPGYVIHHRDRKPLNDTPENLCCMTREEHINEHRRDTTGI